MTAAISSIGAAFPPPMGQEEAWEGFFAEHFAGSRAARRVWRQAGVERRHAVVDPRIEDLSSSSTGTRMQRFVEEAVPLGTKAVVRCLEGAGLDPEQVELLTVVSCTGYATPGVDILVARDLDMSGSLQRLAVGHMGCYAAIPALVAVSDAAVARGKTGVLLCVELTSLHLQPATDDLEQVVAHALFSDAAVAVAVVPDGPGLEVVDVVASTDPSTADRMTWDITDTGFRMRLSQKVPAALEQQVGRVTQELLDGHDLHLDDIDHWAIHPGGPRILSTVAEQLGLAPEATLPSREVLRRYGNCSSATVLLVLDEIVRNGVTPGQHVVAMAFGPGLTLYASLLRVR